MYPPPVNVRVDVLEGVRPTHGFLLIEIPPQPDELNPFFVRASTRSRGLSDTQLTLPVRDGASRHQKATARLHGLLTAGGIMKDRLLSDG